MKFDYDTRQVCKKGHEITQLLRRNPQDGKDLCPRCGSPTLSDCENCGNAIPGAAILKLPMQGQTLCGDHSVPQGPLPKACASCGATFPWAVPAVGTEFEGYLDGFSNFVSPDSGFSIWAIGRELPSHIKQGPIPHHEPKFDVLWNLYYSIRRAFHASQLTDENIHGFVRDFNSAVRSFESFGRDLIGLLKNSGGRKGSIFDDYRRLAQEFNRYIYDYERFLKKLGSPITFARLPTLESIEEAGPPRRDLQRAYGPGEAFDFYGETRTLIESAQTEILIVETYPDEEIFNLYLAKVQPQISIRLLVKNPQGQFKSVAKKFVLSPGRKIEIRQSSELHDRMLFVGNDCYAIGQSLKDAAVKKPTYIVALPKIGSDLLPCYEEIWKGAQVYTL
ncbi:MAG: DUF2321 domain-containing protein [Planctomycetota bacterium]|nr:DUF2321 domain-containing protein [Planctomycetota bacterium]